ncbi:MAG: hypothetical protein QF515_01325 [Pseudomonadales bacterium]|nr:hypothetical protein [Pseudomonadales bacterium]MDP6825751.1 hypothetical protein [Pseudomonadales bacterium]
MRVDGQVLMSDASTHGNGFGEFIDLHYAGERSHQSFGVEYLDERIDIRKLGVTTANNQMGVRCAHSFANLSWAKRNDIELLGFTERRGEGLRAGGGTVFEDLTVFDNAATLAWRSGGTSAQYHDAFGDASFYEVSPRLRTTVEYRAPSSGLLGWSVRAGLFEEKMGGDAFFYGVGMYWRPRENVNVAARISYRNRGGWLLKEGRQHMVSYATRQWEPSLELTYELNARQQLGVSMQWVAIDARQNGYYRLQQVRCIPSGSSIVRQISNWSTCVSHSSGRARWKPV